jgi:hypothetical protein
MMRIGMVSNELKALVYRAQTLERRFGSVPEKLRQDIVNLQTNLRDLRRGR